MQYCSYLVKIVPVLAYFLQKPTVAAIVAVLVAAVVVVLVAAVAAAGMATVLVVL